MIPNKHIPLRHHSQGAILIVCLILLLMMTFLGVSAVDNSALQSQMARNSLFARTLFQASLSEIEAQRNEMENLAYLTSIRTSTTTISKSTHEGISNDSPGITLNSLTTDNTDNYQQTGAVVYTGTSENGGPPLSGYSLGGNSNFIAIYFEANVVSEYTDTGSASDQTQGLLRAAPSD